MDAIDGDVAVTVSGVAPVTLIAQISVALIAVAVTAVYILKHLPDPGENPGPSKGTDCRVGAVRRDEDRLTRSDETTQEPGNTCAVGGADDADGEVSTSHESGEDPEWVPGPSSSRGEYRAIISHEEYQDLCSSPPLEEKPKSARKKGSLSKDWPTSLESIDEEDEEEGDLKTVRANKNENEPKPKHSPKRGSRVPSWYFSISSSGIPALPRDRELDTQFGQFATQSPVGGHPSENITYAFEDISYVDEVRKRAITGFSGTPIGVIQRKPWPQDQTSTDHEYSNIGQISRQSQAMESEHAKTARMNFMLKGRFSSFGNSFTQDYEKSMSIPDIQIHDPSTNDKSLSGGVSNYEYSNQDINEVDSGVVSSSTQWVETMTSTVLLPEKCQDDLKPEFVHINPDEEDGVGRDEVPKEELRNTVSTRPIPKPRASLMGLSHNPQEATCSSLTSESAPPLIDTTLTKNNSGFKPILDIDQPQSQERAPSTGAEQPLTITNDGSHQLTKHSSLGNKKSDAVLQHGVQTGFIKKENIDFSDKGTPSVARYDDDNDYTNFTPDARVFTVVGSTPGPINIRHAVTQSNAKDVEEVNPTPSSDIIVSIPDDQGTPGGDPTFKDQSVTSRSPYEIGTPTEISTDGGELQHVNSAQIVTREKEYQIDHARKEEDTTCVAVETVNAGNEPSETDSKTLHNNGSIPNADWGPGPYAVSLEHEVVNEDFPLNDERENADLHEIRATLTESLPLKRPKELLLNGLSKKQDSKPLNHPSFPNSRGVNPESSGTELSSASSPSDVIAQQRVRIQKSLEKLNVPDWYKKSSHYKRQHGHRDYQFAVEPRMTRSPSSCLSDCWSSVTSSEEATNLPTVSTKLAFQSEARYRRDFPKRLLYEPIRNAFSCAELQTQSSKWVGAEDDAASHTSVIDDAEISRSPDDTNLLHVQTSLNQTSSSLNDIDSGSPPNQSSPSHGLRLRSKSEGDSFDQITYFDSLAVKRLERHMYESIFFVTGYTNDAEDDLGFGQSDRNSLFTSGSLPDESIDDMEYRRQLYEMREAYLQNSALPDLQKTPTVSHNNNLPAENGYTNKEIDNYGVPSDRELGNKHSPTTMASMNATSPGLYTTNHDYRPMESQPKWTPTPAPRRTILQSTTVKGYPTLNDTPQNEELKPDTRYNLDGSRNVKLSPRFAMVTPQSDRERESPRSSPRTSSPRRTTVRIMVTDTSLEDDDIDSGPSTGHRSDQELVSASSSDQETVVDGTTNSWTPLDLEKLKESEFAAVLSVITSRHMNPGNRSGLYVPGSDFIPPKEVTMEEIVDSLLGLPYQRATSAVDLHSSGYRGSSSTSTPLTCSTPDLSSSWSPSRGGTPVSSSDKTHSVDSLHSEDGNVLNSIIVGSRRDQESSSHGSYQEGGDDVIGDEIIMVKCSYKKCAKTKELTEARTSFKTCHNCYTYYCSRKCRKLHWPRHKKRCLFSRVNSACKHVIYHSRYNGQLQSDLTRVARTGYLSRGRGAILLIFPDAEAAENYSDRGFDALPSVPTYSTVHELESSDLFGDHMKFLLEMCCTYDPEKKFVLNVAIMASSEQHRGNRPRRTDTAVKKCAKLSLIPPHTDPSSTKLDPVPDTLIITSPSGPQGVGALDKKSRQVCFVHIQRQLRQRGVNLRHHHAEIYDKLCRWVENHEHFTPITIYPLDERTGKRFMCVLMPEAEPDELGWINNPELLEDIDLDAELEKLENVAGMVVTDL